MRTFAALATTFGVLLASGLALAGLTTGRPGAAAAPLGQTPRPSECVADGQAWAFPRVLLLGETTAVTLNLRAVCAPERPAMHIALVMDGSQSTAGGTGDAMQHAALGLVEALNLRDEPTIQVAVVEFSSTARTLCGLSNVEAQIDSCINRVGGAGAPCIECGIHEAMRVLLTGRRRDPDAGKILETMIIYSDGANAAGCPPVVEAARQAASQAVVVSAVCLTGGCQTECLSQVVGDDDRLHQIGQVGTIAGDIHGAMRRNMTRISIERAVITETLAPGMQLVEGSDVPPAQVGAGGNQLVWTMNALPTDGVTVTYKVRPTQVGQQAVSMGAVAVLTDSTGRMLTVSYDRPGVSTLQPFPVTVTPNPPRWRAYLPVANLPPRAGLP